MDGSLINILCNRRDQIQEAWLNAIFKTYPADTFSYSRKRGTEFTDPVFYTFRNGTKVILDYVLGASEQEKIMESLETMVKIRAVQDFGASQAVKIIYLLKRIIRSEQGQKNISHIDVSEFYELEDRIDQIGLLAFDIYMKCREKIYELRTTELKNAVWSRVVDHESEVPVQT